MLSWFSSVLNWKVFWQRYILSLLPRLDHQGSCVYVVFFVLVLLIAFFLHILRNIPRDLDMERCLKRIIFLLNGSPTRRVIFGSILKISGNCNWWRGDCLWTAVSLVLEEFFQCKECSGYQSSIQVLLIPSVSVPNFSLRERFTRSTAV